MSPEYLSILTSWDKSFTRNKLSPAGQIFPRVPNGFPQIRSPLLRFNAEIRPDAFATNTEEPSTTGDVTMSSTILTARPLRPPEIEVLHMANPLCLNTA